MIPRRAAVALCGILSGGVMAACAGTQVPHASVTTQVLHVSVTTSSSPVPVALFRGPDGADVSSVVQFQGHYVAAGSYFSGNSPSVLPNCSTGCNPQVWTSATGSQWTPTWGATPTGSITGEQLVTTTMGLFLFNDDEGTRLWRSTDAINWQQVQLPAAMAVSDIRTVEWGHNRLVAAFFNKYSSSEELWTSTNGVAWVRIASSGKLASR
jgi:hypothetical protein